MLLLRSSSLGWYYILWTLAVVVVVVANGFLLIPPHNDKRRHRHLGCRAASKESSKEATTLESLGIRLQKELDVCSESEDESSGQGRLQLVLRTRLSRLVLNRTLVGPSSISSAGRGLFARCDCQKGELLTCYPGDAFVILPKDDEDEDVDWTVLWGDHVRKPFFELDQDYMLRAVSDDWGILASPELDQDPAYLGHLANDGARAPDCPAELASYVIESNDRANAMHQPLEDCHMVTVATRTIQKGQEIFVTYGPDYWMEQPMFGSTSSRGETSGSTSFPGQSTSSSSGKGFG
jgi:hypothetical protein